ncbi:MAG: hypothetical protein JWL62_2401 [Hyphomicrobiales bacterium]|nr:hypothetical protein [Hyphomicrobiales bacterium]
MKIRHVAASLALALATLATPAMAQRKPPAQPAAPAPNPNEKTYPVGANWTLREMNGKPIPAGIEATLTIDDRFRASGISGCNTWSATMWPVRNQRFAVGPVALTKKACPAPVMAFERAYLTALHAQPQWDLIGSTLEVKGPAGTLKFARGF